MKEDTYSSNTREKLCTFSLSHIVIENRNVSIPDMLQPYTKLIQEFATLDEIITLQNHVVAPQALRSSVLQYLHAEHQGVHAILARAFQTIYWPKYIEDIGKTRAKCMS